MALNLYFKLENGVNQLEKLSEEHILSKGGFVAFDWWIEQCGNTVWWTLKGYVDNQLIILKVE